MLRTWIFLLCPGAEASQESSIIGATLQRFPSPRASYCCEAKLAFSMHIATLVFSRDLIASKLQFTNTHLNLMTLFPEILSNSRVYYVDLHKLLVFV